MFQSFVSTWKIFSYALWVNQIVSLGVEYIENFSSNPALLNFD